MRDVEVRIQNTTAGLVATRPAAALVETGHADHGRIGSQ
jgi:hypothetical protein